MPHDLRIGQPFCGEYQDRKDLYPLQGERYMTRARCFAASSVVVQEQNVKCNERAVYKKLGLPANSQATDHLSRADWSWKIADSLQVGPTVMVRRIRQVMIGWITWSFQQCWRNSRKTFGLSSCVRKIARLQAVYLLYNDAQQWALNLDIGASISPEALRVAVVATPQTVYQIREMFENMKYEVR